MLGHIEAKTRLGELYSAGAGANIDYSKALHWFQLASNDGDAEAQFLLAEAYLNGNGTDKNFDEAFIWYEKCFAIAHLKCDKWADSCTRSATYARL